MMDLTAPIGAAALVVTLVTVLLIVREVALAVWIALPDWFRLMLVSLLAIALIVSVVR